MTFSSDTEEIRFDDLLTLCERSGDRFGKSCQDRVKEEEGKKRKPSRYSTVPSSGTGLGETFRTLSGLLGMSHRCSTLGHSPNEHACFHLL